MSIEFSELPGWSFDGDEISAGVFTVIGRDRAGRTIEVTGVDPETLMERCKLAALEMMAQNGQGSKAPSGHVRCERRED